MAPFSSQSLSAEISALVALVRPGLVAVGEASGFGSGIVWSEDGLLITNDHVAQSDRPRVRLHDGTELDARVLARDRRNDLAALQIDHLALQPLQRRQTDDLRVGELAIALGHPLGRLDVPTIGIVSGLGNHSWMGRMRRDLIQVDVSLAPGNSGGPILDANAQMIGVACMIASPGMALVIPTRTIERFVAQLSTRRSRAA